MILAICLLTFSGSFGNVDSSIYHNYGIAWECVRADTTAEGKLLRTLRMFWTSGQQGVCLYDIAIGPCGLAVD